jgi:hypothetical protein
MQLTLLRSLIFVDETQPDERDGGVPLRKVAVVGIVRNPMAGQYGEDLSGMSQRAPTSDGLWQSKLLPPWPHIKLAATAKAVL